MVIWTWPALIVLGLSLYAPLAAQAAPFAYITNSYSNSVWVVDTADNSVAAVVHVGSDPAGVAVDSATGRVYITNQNDNSVSVIDAVTNTVFATVALPLSSPTLNAPLSRLQPDAARAALSRAAPRADSGPTPTPTEEGPTPTMSVGPTATPTPRRVGAAPFGVAVDSTAGRGYVSTAGGISVIDLATDAVVASIPLPVPPGPYSRPQGVALSPDGKLLYVAIDAGPYALGAVAALDTGTGTLNTIAVGERPMGIAVNGAGTRVYVTNADSQTVSVIDTISSAVIDTVSLSDAPQGVAVSPAGDQIYVTVRSLTGNPGAVVALDATTDSVIASTPFGSTVYGVSVDPTGHRIYVVDSTNDRLSVIDAEDHTLTSTVGVGRVPVGFGQFVGPAPPPGFTPTGTPTPPPAPYFVYVTNRLSDSISVINPLAGRVVATIPVSTEPFGIAATPDGSFAYVATLADVAVIDLAGHTQGTTAIHDAVAGIAITPDGALAYIAGDPTSWALDTASNAIVATLPFSATSVAAAPDRPFVYLTGHDAALGNVVRVVDTTTQAVAGMIPVGFAAGIDITPDGGFAYVSNGGGLGLGSLAVIDLAHATVAATIPVVYTPAWVRLGDFAFSPEGSFAYMIENLELIGPSPVFFSRLLVVHTDSNTIVDSGLTPEVDPATVAFSPDGAFAYMVNSGANTVSVIDPHTSTIVSSIPVGDAPDAIAVAPAPGAAIPPTITPKPSPSPTATPSPTQTPTIGGCGAMCDGRPCVTRCAGGEIRYGFCTRPALFQACICDVDCPSLATPTFTATSSPSPTPTRTAEPCPVPTSEPLWVDPVTSPTTDLSQSISVYAGNADSVWVTTESGTFFGTGQSPFFTVTVTLLPDTVHHLTVGSHVRVMQDRWGCVYGGYTLAGMSDRFGNPLTIVQQSPAATPTLGGGNGNGGCSLNTQEQRNPDTLLRIVSMVAPFMLMRHLRRRSRQRHTR